MEFLARNWTWMIVVATFVWTCFSLYMGSRREHKIRLGLINEKEGWDGWAMSVLVAGIATGLGGLILILGLVAVNRAVDPLVEGLLKGIVWLAERLAG